MNENEQSREMNEVIMKKMQSYRWKGRALTFMALSVGLLSIVVGILLMWANSSLLFPQIQSLLQQSDAAQAGNTNAVVGTASADPRLTLSNGKTVDRQTMVTLMLGKAMYVTSRAVALLGVGTLLTLLLVIFNRRVTLRQINLSLQQISGQIKQLQDRQGSGPA
jgi:hypothetical protein